jgi:hypothetical protein
MKIEKMLMQATTIENIIYVTIISEYRVSAGRRVRPTHTNFKKLVEICFNIEFLY